MLEPDIVMKGYAIGVFPMADDDGEILWFAPDPRGIIPIEDFHVPHSLAKRLKGDDYEIRHDTVFREVVEQCARRESTWISEDIIECYCALHEKGCAHSVECWIGGRLAGGLYGVSLKGAFFGESMFHHVTDASKIALASLVGHLRKKEFVLLDTQWTTPHLKQFGGKEIPRLEYLELLQKALQTNTGFR